MLNLILFDVWRRIGLHSARFRFALHVNSVKKSQLTLYSAKVIITSDKGGGTCFCPCSFVCLSVSKITQKRVHGFG